MIGKPESVVKLPTRRCWEKQLRRRATNLNEKIFFCWLWSYWEKGGKSFHRAGWLARNSKSWGFVEVITATKGKINDGEERSDHLWVMTTSCRKSYRSWLMARLMSQFSSNPEKIFHPSSRLRNELFMRKLFLCSRRFEVNGDEAEKPADLFGL